VVVNWKFLLFAAGILAAVVCGGNAIADEPFKIVEQKWVEPTEVGSIPAKIRASADEYIIGRLGEDCFSGQVSFLKDFSGMRKSGKSEKFLLSYLLKFRREQWSHVQVVVYVNDGGVCTTSSDNLVPNCEKDASRCAISFTPEDAFNLAWEAGLDPEKGNFSVEFKSISGIAGYVYLVQYSKRIRSGLSGVLINSNNGEVLDTLQTLTTICR